MLFLLLILKMVNINVFQLTKWKTIKVEMNFFFPFIPENQILFPFTYDASKQKNR